MFKHWFETKPPTPADTGSTHLIELRQVSKTYVSAAGPFTALGN